ncbi:hypothetical protein XA68_14403 [Ophiocordyceps unilateralis]|uniref:Uncharacterized protein n=1 Tax=Ophiocordyceps unilateralis TaxID=268505 RepID=A0A2A9PN24_OPHUN|nr:hypothetical protein XA68_14403 [Ophiocordyceps unilateralis]
MFPYAICNFGSILDFWCPLCLLLAVVVHGSDVLSPNGEGWTSSSESVLRRPTSSAYTRFLDIEPGSSSTTLTLLTDEESGNLEGAAYAVNTLARERWLPTVLVIPGNARLILAEPKHVHSGVEPNRPYAEKKLPRVRCHPLMWHRYDRDYVCVGRSVDCFQHAGGRKVTKSLLVPICRCSRLRPTQIPSSTGLLCVSDHSKTRPLVLACRRIHRRRAVGCVGRDARSPTGWFNTTPAVENFRDILQQEESMLQPLHF